MSPSKRYTKECAKARQHRRLQAHERLEHDWRQAQRAAEALHQALEDLGLPDNLMVEIEGRLRSQQKLLGKIVGVIRRSLGAVPLRSCVGCGAGTTVALTNSGRPAQALLAQTAAALGAGGVGAALAACGVQEPGHPESLAVALGLG
jgi:hypothetical protein